MAHTYVNLLYHIIFSTKNRANMIDAELEQQLFPCIAGILRELNSTALEINGPENHVHILAAISQRHSIADIVRTIKSNSSKWVHETFRDRPSFSWPTGYAAFTVSQSAVEQVRAYIKRQKELHRGISFEDEFVAFLNRHGIKHDERYVWD